jgi:hypothetical protein
MIFKEAQIRLSASRGAQWTHPAGSTHHGGSKKCPLAIKHGNGKLPSDTIDALDILMYIYRGFPIAMFENRRLKEFVSGRISRNLHRCRFNLSTYCPWGTQKHMSFLLKQTILNEFWVHDSE